MKFIKKYIPVFQLYMLMTVILISLPSMAQDSRFTVVLDAGHGGHDPGAVSSNSREKDINLDVVLDLGALIEKNYNDVKVVYTRKTDTYLTLQERADVVNNNHADLFICIHTNASNSPSAFGTETFTLGLAKTKANLDVAMRENSVILLEEDYKSKYKGFDPKSVDSYIMFEFMQDKYIDKSVDFSSSIQNQFVNFCHRANHGVRQAGFWVLHRSACPSVLVELGFISNSSEERYLTSDHGQKEMATAIYNAFIDYKRIYDRRSGRQNKNVSKIESIAKDDDSNQNHFTKSDEDQKNTRETKRTTKEINSEKSNSSTADSDQLPVFKVQLFATVKTLGPNAPDFKGVSDVEYFEERGLKKYTLGAETDYSKIEQIRLEILHKFPDAFIIAFIGDRKLTPKEVLKLSK